MKETSSNWKPWAAAVAAAIGLWVVAASRGARETSSPAQRVPAATVGARGSASHVVGASPRLSPPGTRDGDDDIDVHAPFEITAHDDAAAVDAERPAGAATQPRLRADVHRPPPPEAVLPPQPHAGSLNRDTGLVFRFDSPGDGEVGQAKEVKLSGTPERSNGPTQPPFTADLHPAPDPVAWEPTPQTAPNRDTGLVFSNQPLRPTDASGQKR